MRSSIDISLPMLIAQIDTWRKPTVEVANLGVPPHITLLYPWRNAPVSPNDLTELSQLLISFQPFELCFNRLETFQAGVIYLALEDESVPRAIMKKLFEGFPDTKPYDGIFIDPTPHVTVVKAKKDELEKLRLEITQALELPIKILVKEITVMEEDSEGYWKNRYVHKLEKS